MSFEVRELPDVIKIISLLTIGEGVQRKVLLSRIDRLCVRRVCLDVSDFDRAVDEMVKEGLVGLKPDGAVELTDRGRSLAHEWRNLLLGEEPIMELVAGLTDGSITSLVVIISAHLTGLPIGVTTFAAFLTLSSMALTNFSSFFLGGKTEDISDMVSIQNLINFSLSDIPDREQRSKSLSLTKSLFTLLGREISRINLKAAVVSGVVTFLASIIPLAAYLALPDPWDLVLSLGIVAGVVGFFLVRYRAKKTKVPWRVTLLETLVIITMAVIASLFLGQGF